MSDIRPDDDRLDELTAPEDPEEFTAEGLPDIGLEVPLDDAVEQRSTLDDTEDDRD